MTTTLFAHFDGNRSLVLDQPVDLPVGTRLRVHLEPITSEPEQPVSPPVPTVTRVPRKWQPLDIHIDPELSNAIALDPEFNIEES
jgi:hypothetical protein